MTIRFVEANDFETWLTLWKGYQEFYQSSIDDQVTRSTFSRFLSEQEPVYCLVIEDESQKIIGFVHYIFHRSTWSEGNYCYLQDLFVDPAQRTSGIGRKLIEEVYKIAEEKKCSRKKPIIKLECSMIESQTILALFNTENYFIKLINYRSRCIQ